MQAKGLVKRYGQVTALDGADFELRAGEILAVIGDNGAGKSSLIKACRAPPFPTKARSCWTASASGSRAHRRAPCRHRNCVPGPGRGPGHDHCREPVPGPRDAPPRLLGSVLRMLDKKKMLEKAIARMADLKVGIRSHDAGGGDLSGGQRQCVAVARAAAFAQHVVIMDEPTAALGVKEGNMVLELIRRVRDKGLPVILISHNMPHVFEIADRIHIARLGKRAAVRQPQEDQHERHRGGDDRAPAAGCL
jgi:fructose transport system ATP-binding protein